MQTEQGIHHLSSKENATMFKLKVMHEQKKNLSKVLYNLDSELDLRVIGPL